MDSYEKLFMKSCKQEEKERRKDGHPGIGGDLNLGPPHQQPSVLTTTPCHIPMAVKTSNSIFSLVCDISFCPYSFKVCYLG